MNDSKLAEALAAMTTTDAAGDYSPLPPGTFEVDVVKGELGESRRGTPAYTVTYSVTGGEHVGRRLFGDIYLSERAMPHAVRDLSKLFGRRPTPDDLQAPFPPGVRARVRVERQKSDAGAEFNRVRLIDVTAREPVPANPFPPAGEGVTL